MRAVMKHPLLVIALLLAPGMTAAGPEAAPAAPGAAPAPGVGAGAAPGPAPAPEAGSEPEPDPEPEAVVEGEAETIELVDRPPPGSQGAIGEEALERAEHDDIHKILSHVAGVYLRDEDGYGLRPNIGMRGAAAERSAKVALME